MRSSLRKVAAVKAIRGATQVARKVLDVDIDELAGMVRACCGSGEARGPFEKRNPASRTARRLVWESAFFPEFGGHWPGVRTSPRGSPGEVSRGP